MHTLNLFRFFKPKISLVLLSRYEFLISFTFLCLIYLHH